MLFLGEDYYDERGTTLLLQLIDPEEAISQK
jgi:hypothetical protein